jgi:endoglucanase
MIQEKFYATWLQIGTTLACKSNLVALEPINESPSSTAEHAVLTNEFNNLFLKALKASGGFNTQRVVTLAGPGMDGVKTTQWFKPPTWNFTNPWALQYHYYSPCESSVR